jgi:hypothetical protein
MLPAGSRGPLLRRYSSAVHSAAKAGTLGGRSSRHTTWAAAIATVAMITTVLMTDIFTKPRSHIIVWSDRDLSPPFVFSSCPQPTTHVARHQPCVTCMFSCNPMMRHAVVVNIRPLFVLIDGEPGDSGLVRMARQYADAKGCSVTLLRVLPEVTRAYRSDSGTLVLPWQATQVMKADATFELDRLRERFLGDRTLPTKMLVRFGDVIDQVAAACYAAHPHAILVRSKPPARMRRHNRDQRLIRRLALPVLVLDDDDRLIGDQAPDETVAMPLSFADKVNALYQLPVFAGMSRKELEMIARNLDEANVGAGTIVTREGKSNRAFWIVVDGELELALRGKVLERITSPGLVGVPSMLDGSPAWATVIAVTPVRALVASTEQFRALRADDRVALRLWAATGARLRHHIVESMREAG